MNDFDPFTLLQKQWAVLGHEGLGWTEIRIPQKHFQAFVDNEKDFVETSLAHCRGPVYVGINPRKNKNGKEEDVASITGIVFDFDPVRPKDAPSTDEQYREAVRLAGDFSRSMDGLLVSSGSGAHVYMPVVPIPVVDVRETADALRNFGKGIQSKYGTKDIKIDSIFDLPRIIRCWGSWNTKSNRPCEFLSGQYRRRAFSLSEYVNKQKPLVPAGAGAIVSKASTGLFERYGRAIQTVPQLKEIVEGRRRYPSRSESDFAFSSLLFKEGFSVEEVKTLVVKNPLGKAPTRTPSDLDREIRRIYDKIKGEIKVEDYSLSADSYMKDLESRAPGIMTGFRKWDSMTAGLKPSRFYIEAGRPTEGKTTHLVQTAVNVAKQGYRVLYFPTECARSSIVDKMVSSAAKVNLSKFQKGDFDPEEKARCKEVLPGILKLPITIAENFSLKLADVDRIVKSVSPDYVIIDYLNGMSYNDVNNPSELGAVVMGVKLIGKNRNIPLTMAVQLHRKPAGVEDSLSDLKGTGKIEEEGDVITFIRTVDASVYPVKSKATIFKNKYGEPGIIPLRFSRAVCEFEEVSDDDPEG